MTTKKNAAQAGTRTAQQTSAKLNVTTLDPLQGWFGLAKNSIALHKKQPWIKKRGKA